MNVGHLTINVMVDCLRFNFAKKAEQSAAKRAKRSFASKLKFFLHEASLRASLCSAFYQN
jgi:hypothetical protein